MTIATFQPAVGRDVQIAAAHSTWNYGASTTLINANSSKGLVAFDLSTIPAGSVCNSAFLTLCQMATGANSAFQLRAYAIAAANNDWAIGASDGAQAGAGEVCWDAKIADGAGGVTTAWAGAAGLATSGVDFDAPLLMFANGNRSDANGTPYMLQLPGNVVQTWFGLAVNGGVLITTTATIGGLASSRHGTAAWRPKLTLNYTAPVNSQHFVSRNPALLGETVISTFETNDIEEASAVVTYIGKEKADGTWAVVKIDSTAGYVITYATNTNNGAVATYATAWAGRAGLTYNVYSTAF